MRRIFCLLLPFFVFCSLLSSIFIAYSLLPWTDGSSSDPFDLFIYSSYYFEKSMSLGENTVAIVFTGDYEMIEDDDPWLKLSFTSFAGEEKKISRGVVKRVTPHNVCKWIVFQAVVPVLPGTERLAISSGDHWVEIPLSEPVKRKHDVVTCIAPMFANEQWQTAIFALHVYKRFGSHMHLYVRSMVAPLFEVIQEYEKKGYLTIQAWLRVVLKSVPESLLNPNINIEFRNQAAAQTDCLLQYKESAAFITFMDLDDILIPRLGSTYFEEFHFLFHSMPNIAYLHYTKENTEAISRISGEDFSFSEMLSTIKFTHRTETGKMVANPAHVNSTWIHWPVRLGYAMESYNVPSHINAITHIKTLKREEGRGQEMFSLPKYNPIEGKTLEPERLLSAEDATAMREDFSKMMDVQEIAERMPLMPKKFFYLKLIADCFERTFYQFHYSGQLKKIKCPGPDRCSFPESPGILCYNSNAEYHSSDGHEFNIHFATKEKFIKEDGCRQ